MAANLDFSRYLRFYLRYLMNAGIVVFINSYGICTGKFGTFLASYCQLIKIDVFLSDH